MCGGAEGREGGTGGGERGGQEGVGGEEGLRVPEGKIPTEERV